LKFIVGLLLAGTRSRLRTAYDDCGFPASTLGRQPISAGRQSAFDASFGMIWALPPLGRISLSWPSSQRTR
jgi:hypothetical protein